MLKDLALAFQTYYALNPNGYVAAEHDIIYFCDMTDEDNSQGLEALGAHWEDHCWAFYV